MRLKGVRIYGFKTFADRTELSLDGPTVAIVGPNGCGKSNLVDAILWGLGEGNSRLLRAASGQDVIFNGSERRKPVGFAEVTLTFDNEDRALPIDAAEVSVTRRLVRGGDGQYAINKRPCRLRDVHDLLSDSGLGRAGYAIIGQKEIDAALSASAEERRDWIDEAAGVQRYRARKNEAVRRLAAASEHLVQVEGVLHEIERQREPLRREADTARRFLALRERWTELETRILHHDGTRAAREVEAARRDALRLTEEIGRLSNERTLRKAEATAAVDRSQRAESAWDEARTAVATAETALVRAEADRDRERERAKGIAERRRMLDESGTRDEGRATASRDELLAALADRDAARNEVATLRSARDAATVAETEARRTAKTAADGLEKARRAEADTVRREARATALAERSVRARKDLAAAEAQLPDLRAAIEEYRPEHEAADRAVGDAQARLAAARTGLTNARNAARDLLARDRTAEDERIRLRTRIEALEGLAAAHEGLAQGPRAVVEAAERGLLDGSYRPVGETLDAPGDLAAAFETALGAAANDLIVAREADAKAAIEWLKRMRAGRATFQPIPLMRPVIVSSDLHRVLGTKGVIGRASELARYPSDVRPVIESLLGRVVIVETLDVGLSLARTSGWSRLVTAEGETIHASGAVSGGVLARQGAGMVARRAEIEALRRELDLKSGGARKTDDGVDRAEAELAASETVLAAAKTAFDEADSYLRTLIGELRSAERDRDRLLKELGEEAAPVEEAERVDPALLQAEADRTAAILTERTNESVAARVGLEAAERRLADADRVAIAAERRAEAADLDGRGRAALEESLVREAEEAEAAIRDREAAIVVAAGALDRRKAEEAEANAARGAAVEASGRAALAVRATEDAILGAETDLAKREAAGIGAGEREAAIRDRLREEFGVTELHPVVEPTDEERQEAARARRELRMMGDVNVGAIEAFDRLEERYAEQKRSFDDVTAGIDELRGSIRELDKLVRTRFVATFERVREEFASAFGRLFEGGAGDLALTDDTDLETGIEVIVRLPGKNRQALTALSGGERALSTVALLYALLKVKPSPLVVLDEVDAPLDARNVERLADLLQDLREEVQFLLITHNPSTIARAPLWLGVSMQEPGVSVLVPARTPVH